MITDLIWRENRIQKYRGSSPSFVGFGGFQVWRFEVKGS